MDCLMDPTIRLRIATRIHFALLRHYNEDVAVSSLLKDERVARETLWVCEASGHEELITLGQQFETAARQEARAVQLRAREAATTAARGATPQDMAWSQDTSGFGLSRLPELAQPAPAEASRWLKPSSWLRRDAARGTR
jgi:hypothetical protein